MNSNNNRFTTMATAARPFNALRYVLECNLIEVYNLMEAYWSPEYEQFKWLV